MNINTKKYIEAFIKIRDKKADIVPLKINKPQQKLYDLIKEQRQKGEPVRIVILKARQMGFSTLTEAIIFKETATKFNVRSGVITHKEEATTNLFNMFKLMYEQLPIEMKPAKKNSNAKEFIFDNKQGTGLKSKVKCMTAGGDGVGRSDTFNNLHISEYAFWRGDKADTLTGLLQAVPDLPNTMIIIESTANGYEHFKDIWDKAVSGESSYKPLFVAWYELEEYQRRYTGFELTEYEERIKNLYNLTNEQLEWRRWTIANNFNGDVEMFKQEYPANPQEAFISTGSCVFDKEKIIERLQQIPKPIAIGQFEYEETDKGITKIKWIDDKQGHIKIYKRPGKSKYAIGGDTAGEGSDSFTGQVIDAATGEQMAVLKHQFDSDLYARQMYCLGKFYKNALIGIESNYDSYPIKELQRIGYKNLYVREKEDTFTGKPELSFGFRTTVKTRPVVISNLIKIAREQIDLFNDRETLEEMLVFVRNEQGRAEAQKGKHDDLVMAMAIAQYISDQVIIPQDIEEDIRKVFNFKIEKPPEGDIGSQIVVI